MTSYELIPDSKEIIKKLQLKKIDILPKHRYIYEAGSRSYVLKNKALGIVNKRYDASYKPIIQTELF
jgi:hypothetical protein